MCRTQAHGPLDEWMPPCVRFDRSSATRVASTERLLQDVVGSVRVVAVAPDAGLYVATDDAIAQISMAE